MMEKILIVDDNSTNLYLLKSLLEEEGFTVTAAKDGQEALDSAHADPPDLIVSDILMPVMDGYLFCRKCKEDEQLRQIPFVFYTATYTEPKDEKFALSLGADRFVLKPQEPETLLRILNEIWEERSAAGPVAPKPFGEEMEFFRQYNEILFRKLEKKMLDLEMANRKLKCLEEQYRLSFENVTDIVWTIDTNFNVRKLSPSVERMLGYKSQDFIGRSVSDLVKILTPESMERAMEEISLVLSGQSIPASVYSLVAKDGTVKHGEFSGSPILREGEIVGMVSVIRDITERKRMEEKLRVSERKYRELFDFLPIPVYEMDLEANITSANRSIYETFGGAEGDLKAGFNAWQLLSPENIDKSTKNIQRLLQGEKIEGTEYTLKKIDGSLFPAIVISNVIYNNGKPVGLRGAIIEITERKRAEEDLRRMNTFLDSVFENIPNMLFLKAAKDLSFIRYNRAGEELLGYSRDELTGKNVYDFFPKGQADHFTENDREALRGKVLVDIPEEFIQTRNKGERILHTQKVPILDANGEPEYLLGISEDITDRKQMETERQQNVVRLRKTLDATVHAIAVTVETRDPYTAGHQRRVADLSNAIASEMGLSTDQIDGLYMASKIHDLGKISIPADILSKPTKLTPIEFALIKVHAQSGYEILKDIEFPWPIARMVLEHHERMDGSGYPNGLTGDKLLVESRIISVADVVESMANHRPYRPSLGIRAALDEIAKCRGVLYDPDVVDACLKIFNEKGYEMVA